MSRWIVAPVFVYQGVRDPVTPRHEADQVVAALRRRHVPVEYMDSRETYASPEAAKQAFERLNKLLAGEGYKAG